MFQNDHLSFKKCNKPSKIPFPWCTEGWLHIPELLLVVRKIAIRGDKVTSPSRSSAFLWWGFFSDCPVKSLFQNLVMRQVRITVYVAGVIHDKVAARVLLYERIVRDTVGIRLVFEVLVDSLGNWVLLSQLVLVQPLGIWVLLLGLVLDVLDYVIY